MTHPTAWLLALAVAAAPFGSALAAEKDTAESETAQDFRSNFVELCRYDHRAPDDPIVHPGMAGMSHSHDFFANTTTNASSTYDSLRAGGTTCADRNDTAAYWVPTLSQNGSAITPTHVRVYYRPGTPRDFASVKPFPAGLRVIAGDATLQTPSTRPVAAWSCAAETMPTPAPPVTCPSGPNQHLRLHIRFPSCWDGVNLDSADHKSHLAYQQRGSCPSSHPVRVPALALIVHYPITGPVGTITLASGSPYSAHADFFNAWNQDALAAKVQRCLNAGIVCGVDKPASRR